MLERITKNQEETIELGKEIAKKLHGGEVLALNGDLGAGKTTFVKGIAKGLGIKQNITSPTFVLMKIYEIKNFPRLELGTRVKFKIKNLVHVDYYRLKSLDDTLSLGITDYLGKKDTICIIEWANKIKFFLPEKTLKIKFKYIDENKRKIQLIN